MEFDLSSEHNALDTRLGFASLSIELVYVPIASQNSSANYDRLVISVSPRNLFSLWLIYNPSISYLSHPLPAVPLSSPTNHRTWPRPVVCHPFPVLHPLPSHSILISPHSLPVLFLSVAVPMGSLLRPFLLVLNLSFLRPLPVSPARQFSVPVHSPFQI